MTMVTETLERAPGGQDAYVEHALAEGDAGAAARRLGWPAGTYMVVRFAGTDGLPAPTILLKRVRFAGVRPPGGRGDHALADGTREA